jgi:hypothetical protein
MTAAQPTAEALRKAAEALLDPKAHDLDDDFAPIPKALLGSLFEEAFAEKPARGLTYADEMRDIAEWLTRFVALYTEPDRYEILLATGAAWAASYTVDPKAGNERVELVRAVAKFFLRQQVEIAADLLEDEGSNDDEEEQGDDDGE